MYDTYEAAAGAKVTKEQAKCEIRKHGADWTEFVAECGDRATYRGRVVLEWLGY